MNAFCEMIYIFMKKIPVGSMKFNPKNERSVCTRAMAIVNVPQEANDDGSDMASKFYWNKFVMPMVNKKCGDMKSSDIMRTRNQFNRVYQ